MFDEMGHELLRNCFNDCAGSSVPISPPPALDLMRSVTSGLKPTAARSPGRTRPLQGAEEVRAAPLALEERMRDALEHGDLQRDRPRQPVQLTPRSRRRRSSDETLERFACSAASNPRQRLAAGLTRPVALKVTMFKCIPHPFFKREWCGADLFGTLKRDEFGLDYAPQWVSSRK